ncbi:MAG: 4-hydroxybutyrate--acetyl-CoA CoA transferase [Oscillospiraceae bacterium]|nr:4-hydroxybutyrate--acetyl-CoA CoA transferase [Oscillospiraceae bacterium]
MNRFNELYQKKLMTIGQLASLAESGWNFCSDIGISIPFAMYDAIGARARNGEISNVTMQNFLDVSTMPCFENDLSGKIRGISWFTGVEGRKAINSGHADVMPNYFRDAPSLFRDFVDIDAYCAVASPMDKHGYFSTCNAACSFALSRKAKHIFLEVNENMPRSAYTSFIHISQVTALCENHIPLATSAPDKEDEIGTAIGRIIADEIPNGSTIQLGIGNIPGAVGRLLKEKRNLGIHTELFTDTMMNLLECGAADNSRKSIHDGRSVATFVFGSKKLYDFVDDNPSIEMHPVDYVNDPAVIARNQSMMSINAAVEVDFMGQVCAESIGSRHISGTGGQVDFVRGAVQSSGGKSFIAFTSTASGGKISRISPVLKSGAFVTTSKNDVDHVVTEYGIAKLRGKSVYQRAKALIAIAHPNFRDELTHEARKLNIIV